MIYLASILAAFFWFTPAVADAEDPVLIRLQMQEYFAGEKAQAWVFLGSGLASLGASAYLFTREDELPRAAGYPVVASGLLNAAVGIGLLAKSDDQIRERTARIAGDPVALKRDELARMSGVSARFIWAQAIEIAAIATGIGLVAWGEATDEPTLTGVGLGLTIEALMLLGLDFLADARADRYLEALRGFVPTVSQHAVRLEWFAKF